jgi:hypothetical protein
MIKQIVAGKIGSLMSLLNKILKNLAERTPKPSDAELREEIREVTKDGRLHVRHPVPMAIKAEVLFPDGSLGEVKNVSYGGLGVELNDNTSLLRLVKEASVDFLALRIKTTFKVNIVRVDSEGRQKTFVGMAFCHDSPEVLIFLRVLIDGMRYGSSMVTIPPEVRKEALRGPQWHCLRGDGPCDLTIRTGERKIASAIFTFPCQGSYGEVSYSDGQLTTREAVPITDLSDHRPSQLMQTTSRISLDTLRRAAWILASTPQGVQAYTKPLLDEVLAHLT